MNEFAGREPRTLEEAQELLRSGARLCIVGGGTAVAPQPDVDLLLTTRLNRVLEYNPSDQVVTVEAGVTLAALQRELAAKGQRLALDPPQPDRATLGGIIAANSFGPLRARFGSVRDLIIGISILRADGTLAKGGGKVVKTVAGFDLPKLLCGSFGTLGLIVTATFRVHPLAEATQDVVRRGLDAAGVVAAVAQLRQGQFEPAAVVATRVSGRYQLGIRLEGFEAGVRQQVNALAAEPAPKDLWAAHERDRCAGPVRLKLAALPTDLPRVEAALAPLGPDVAFSWYATLGLGFVSGAIDAAAVEALRRALAALHGSVVVEAGPATLDRFGPPPAAIALHKSIKARFDPQGVFAPGRFVGGI